MSTSTVFADRLSKTRTVMSGLTALKRPINYTTVNADMHRRFGHGIKSSHYGQAKEIIEAERDAPRQTSHNPIATTAAPSTTSAQPSVPNAQNNGNATAATMSSNSGDNFTNGLLEFSKLCKTHGMQNIRKYVEICDSVLGS